MPQVIGVKVGSEDGKITLALVQNYIQSNGTLSLTYYVVADNSSQDFLAISQTSGLPQLGSRLYSMYCTETNPVGQTSVIHFLTGVLTILWEVEIAFTTMMRDPSDNTPDVNWSGEIDKEFMPSDVITGAKVVNTAGEPLFTDKPVIYQTLRIHRRESYPFDPSVPLRFVARVNSQQFYGYPIGSCLMLPIEVEEDTQDNQRVVWVTYSIKISIRWNFDGTLQANSWQAQLLNEGQTHRDIPGGIAKTNDDGHGQIIKRNLDLNGLILKDLEITDLRSDGQFLSSVVPSWKVDSPMLIPLTSDIGNRMVIHDSSAPWNNGTYRILDVRTISSTTYWFLDANPGSVGATGGKATIVRDPIFIYFNRFFYADFNQLTLGPY